MDLTQIILITLSIAFACALQGAVGFGAGMFSIPLMIWAGVDLPSAIMIVLVCALVQCGWNLYRYKDHVTIRELMPLFVLRAMSMPVGVVLLGLLVGLGTVRVKQFVGLMLLTAVLIQWLGRVKPRERVTGGWTVLAGTFSGLFAGLVGMGGPPVVLWVMAHDWPARKSRSFLWASFLLLIPFNAAVLLYRFPGKLWWAMLLGLCLAPVVLAGAELGQRLGGLMNRQKLRTAAFGLLLLLAVISILGPMLGGRG